MNDDHSMDTRKKTVVEFGNERAATFATLLQNIALTVKGGGDFDTLFLIDLINNSALYLACLEQERRNKGLGNNE